MAKTSRSLKEVLNGFDRALRASVEFCSPDIKPWATHLQLQGGGGHTLITSISRVLEDRRQHARAIKPWATHLGLQGRGGHTLIISISRVLEDRHQHTRATREQNWVPTHITVKLGRSILAAQDLQR